MMKIYDNGKAYSLAWLRRDKISAILWSQHQQWQKKELDSCELAVALPKYQIALTPLSGLEPWTINHELKGNTPAPAPV